MAQTDTHDLERALQRAAALHDAGDLAAAMELISSQRTRHGDEPRLDYLEGCVRLAQGDSVRAVELFEGFARRQPDFAEVHAQLGRARHALGQHPAARAAWSRYLALRRHDPRGLLELGTVCAQAGDLAAADAAFEQLLGVVQQSSQLLAHVGLVYHQAGHLDRAAELYLRALAADGGDMLARARLGACRHAAGRLDEAECLYREVLAAEPADVETLKNLGTLLKERGALHEAVDLYRRAARAARAPRTQQGRDDDAGSREGRITSVHKLALEREQLEYLLARGRLSDAYRPYLERYDAVLAEMGRHPVPGHRRRLSDAQFAAIGPLVNRLWYEDAGAAVSGAALNPAVDFTAAEQCYAQAAPGLVVIDDFLAPQTLAALRRYCLETTFWFDYSKAGGYCGAYMEEGFGAPLLLQISDELRAAMPGLLGRHALNQMWGYIYDSRRSGITLHADAAAVNLNFWITPDEANLDPGSGGLVVYLREAPLEWDFDDFNNEPERLQRFVADAERVVVPHRCNRLVAFHSNLVHATDEFRFRPGLESRRINITMLFGRRGSARP